MRESPRSIQLYLVLGGIVGVLASGGLMLREKGWLGPLLAGAGLAVAASCLWLGVRFPAALREAPATADRVLSAAVIFLSAVALFRLMALGPVAAAIPVLGALLMVHLQTNARRLSAESRAERLVADPAAGDV